MLTTPAALSRAVLGLALVAGLAAPALAQDRIDVIGPSAKASTQQLLVRIADLDLNSRKGMTALGRRIAIAAESVCGKDKLYTNDARSDYLRCRADAISDAHRQVQQPVNTSPVRPA